MSPSPYTLLPSNAEEKPRLERAPSLTPRRTEPVHPASKRWAFVLAGGFGFIVLLLVGALYWAVPALGPGAMLGKACGNSEDSAAAASGEIMTTPSGGEDAMAKESKTGERVLPMFSTSVYPNGDTSSFVFTTRPIVNPGGYTIGTLTGYVHLTATPSPTSPAAATPTATFRPEADAEPDLHVRHKRGLDEFEDVLAADDDDLVPSPTTLPDGSEYSFSLERNGDISAYVKTTRPIVNPGGWVIGTLDGAYVRVGKMTPLATQTALPVVVQQNHNELRKRRENGEA